MVATVPFMPITPVRAQTSGKYFNNIVTIIMENEGICDILGQNLSYRGITGCSAVNYAPYMTRLAQNWALSIQYSALSHPLIPTYLALFNYQTCARHNYGPGPTSNA